jgi:hypothetical protein
LIDKDSAPISTSSFDNDRDDAADMKLARVLVGLFRVLRRYGLVLSADLAILLKTVISVKAPPASSTPLPR